MSSPVVTRPVPGTYHKDAAFIDGTWVQASGDRWHSVYDCGTHDELGRVRAASPDDARAAVRAADRAQDAWAATTVGDRVAALGRLHDALASRASELTAVIAAEVGTAVTIAGAIQVHSAINTVALMAEVLAQESFEERIANSTVQHVPMGVVAAITPWNYPLFQTMNKVAGALAAGCTVVHKPSQLAPLSAFILAEAVAEAGLPAGVYNLVPGDGRVVGETLATDPAVRMMSFTGSTRAGRRVYELGSATMKRVSLELGGKSASVLLDDAELDVAVKASVNRAFLNSGQTCDAWTRLLVPRSLQNEVLSRAVEAAARLRVGDQFDPATRLGPLISAAQAEQVRAFIAGALAGGARAVAGGVEPPAGLENGHYVQATVLADVEPGMTIAREEVFGPVLAVMAYDDEEHAIRTANSTDYGLSGAVWSADVERATRVASRMRTGQVVINGGKFNPYAPFGGWGQSGLGREMGSHGLREFLETRALQY